MKNLVADKKRMHLYLGSQRLQIYRTKMTNSQVVRQRQQLSTVVSQNSCSQNYGRFSILFFFVIHVTIGGWGGRSTLRFFSVMKFTYGSNFSLKMFFFFLSIKYIGNKSLNFSLRSLFFVQCRLNVFRSALVLRNVPCPEKFMVTLLLVVVVSQQDGVT